MLGQLPAYNASPLEFVASVARDYGDIVPLRLGPVNAVLVSDPVAIETVLIERSGSFRKARGVRRLRTLLGDGLLLTEGQLWLRERRLMQPAFHRGSVARCAETMVRRSLAALDRWGVGDVIDVENEMRGLTIQIAAESLFGSDLTVEEEQVVSESLQVAGAQIQTRVSSLLMFVPDWLPTPGNLRMNLAIRRVNRAVFRILEERRRSTVSHDDLLSLLMGETDDRGRMSDRQLRDEVITLLVAGHDTTALTMSWILYLLSRHPAVEAKVRGELGEVLTGGRSPTAADLPRLKYTAHVISETLRLYPAGYITAREATQDMVIEGFLIRKGAVVLMSQWSRHRDPRIFPDPDAFKPERWDAGLETRLRRGDYFPFGMGARQCIGAAFATVELTLVLATLLGRYRFEATSIDEVRPVPIVALHPDRPIRLRCAPAR